MSFVNRKVVLRVMGRQDTGIRIAILAGMWAKSKSL